MSSLQAPAVVALSSITELCLPVAFSLLLLKAHRITLETVVFLAGPTPLAPLSKAQELTQHSKKCRLQTSKKKKKRKKAQLTFELFILISI